MIFKKQSKPAQLPAKVIAQSKSWKQKFKIELYKRNYNNIYDADCNETFNGDCRNQAAMRLIENVRINHSKYKQPENADPKITHPFCVYVPLKKSVQFDDQIVNTFLYLRNLKQSNDMFEQDNFYCEIRKFMKQCKDSNRIKQGWEICLRRFITNLDVLRRIQIFVNLQRYGSQNIKLFHRTFSKPCLFDVFIQRIMDVNKYFQRSIRINRTWKISVELNEKINQANISKTMKMLYCSLCLIYDCGKHKLEDLSHEKDHHYSSPKNRIPKSVHIVKAIQLLKQLKDLQINKTQQHNRCCSQKCFRILNKKSFIEAQFNKSRVISPMVESLIKIGIQLFSYSPCKICYLFPHDNVVNCSVIFLYLIEQVNLQSRLDYKISSSQTDFLSKQSFNNSFSTTYKNTNRVLSAIKRKKAKQYRSQQFKYHPVAICMHSFIGQELFDQGCKNCACHLRGFCLPQCQCTSSCPLMLRGCCCKSKQDCQTMKCSCYRAKNECIPGICTSCYPSICCPKKNACKNDQILRQQSKSIKIGLSKIPGAGFGAFAGQRIKKGSLISIYCGEIVDQEMEGIRETLKKDLSFYNFGCSEGSIDARYMGNKTRFINHSNEYENKTNLVSLNIFSCGQQYIGLYALKDIEEDDQLLFDYDGEGIVAQAHCQYQFLKKNIKCLQN